MAVANSTDSQHAVVPPDASLVKHISHVALAFLNSALFNGEPIRPGTRQWPLFAPVPSIRSQFTSGTKVLIALGGWGDTAGFEAAAKDDKSRSLWAKNVAVMVEDVGADGMSTRIRSICFTGYLTVFRSRRRLGVSRVRFPHSSRPDTSA